MNCKPGDVAMVIKNTIPENIGRIVVVVSERVRQPHETWPVDAPAWWVTPNLLKAPGLSPQSTYDHCLRPLRDSDGVDETLRDKEKEEQ